MITYPKFVSACPIIQFLNFVCNKILVWRKNTQTHLETVFDLITTAFIAMLRRFIAWHGKPSVFWGYRWTNFVGAAKELKQLHEFWCHQDTKEFIADFCSGQGILWRFMLEHAPHFGGLREAAVKSFKHHVRRIVCDVCLTFQQLATTLAKIEACLNSMSLVCPCQVPKRARKP